jgi:glutamyl-tRNA synthetase
MTAPIRVRFAPSPTGWLHVGGARTALFNWLFARQHHGVFVMRIEDTDVQRSSAESETGVLDDLRWLGLEWDEGPDIGGSHGPYRQSERLDLYHAAAERLRAAGLAYPCYCTDAELEQRRAAAVAAGRPPHYDGTCRRLTAEQRAAREREGRTSSVRFGVEPRDWVLEDLVRGEVRFPAGMVGDFVLLRSNGLPTYNFAVVVDDAAMRISHVIRAEEHLANTPRQLMLYAALGEQPPAFAHVPLILNRDRSKMSKREGEAAVAVGDWRRAGYVPDALVNYLALLGFHPGDDRELMTRAELLVAFSLERVGKSGSVFDPDKLRWVNAHYLHHADGSTLRAWARSFLPPAAATLDESALESLLVLVRGNVETLAALPGELAPFVSERFDVEEAARAVFEADSARRVCAGVAEAWASLADWNPDGIKSALQSAGRGLAVKGRELFQPVRVALTGRTHGPELPLVAGALGRDRCVARLRRAATEGSL